MNLRVIKKDIEYFIGEFLDDCSLFLSVNPEKGDKITALMDEAVNLYNQLKDKINHPDTAALKSHYNGLRDEMFNQLDSLCEKLSETVAERGKKE